MRERVARRVWTEAAQPGERLQRWARCGEDAIADTLTGQQLPHEEQAEAEGQDALTGSLLALQGLWASLEAQGAFLFWGPQGPPAQINYSQGQGPLAFLFLEILSSNGPDSPLSAMDWAG